jgi:[acyl-carrier-protein] S-malonyltransferase
MKIAMLFPGYGSQFVGMSKELYDESRVMQEYFEEAANCLNQNFVQLCFAASDVELGRLERAYPAIFLVSSSLGKIIKDLGIVPDVVAGYGIGQYAAIHTFGGLSFPDGLYFLSRYARSFQEMLDVTPLSGMRVVGLDASEIERLCAEVSTPDALVYVALYNRENDQTVMGHMSAVDGIRVRLAERDEVAVQTADVEAGLHSTLMDSIVATMKLNAEKIDFKDVEVPVIANDTGKIVQHADEIKASCMKQIHRPVRWPLVVDALHDCDVIIEVGPGQTLHDYVLERYPDKKYFIVNKPKDLAMLKAMVADTIQKSDTDETVDTRELEE